MARVTACEIYAVEQKPLHITNEKKIMAFVQQTAVVETHLERFEFEDLQVPRKVAATHSRSSGLSNSGSLFTEPH